MSELQSHKQDDNHSDHHQTTGDTIGSTSLEAPLFYGSIGGSSSSNDSILSPDLNSILKSQTILGNRMTIQLFRKDAPPSRPKDVNQPAFSGLRMVHRQPEIGNSQNIYSGDTSTNSPQLKVDSHTELTKGIIQQAQKRKNTRGGSTSKKQKLPTFDDHKRDMLSGNNCDLHIAISKAIHDSNPNLVQMWNVHGHDIEVGSNEEVVPPHSYEENTKFLRHLCTSINYDGYFMEVQAALIKNEDDEMEIYISSNKKMTELPETWGEVEEFIRYALENGSERDIRHATQLQKELQDFSDYPIRVVTQGEVDQHAETRIVNEALDNNVAIHEIAGQRRPCTACTIFLQLQDVDSGIYNPHHGANWDTFAALKSIITLARDQILEDYLIEDLTGEKDGEKIKSKIQDAIDEWINDNLDKFEVEDTFYRNEGVEGRDVLAIGSDSEEDSDDEDSDNEQSSSESSSSG